MSLHCLRVLPVNYYNIRDFNSVRSSLAETEEAWSEQRASSVSDSVQLSDKMLPSAGERVNYTGPHITNGHSGHKIRSFDSFSFFYWNAFNNVTMSQNSANAVSHQTQSEPPSNITFSSSTCLIYNWGHS